jgi:hypothetical protein
MKDSPVSVYQGQVVPENATYNDYDNDVTAEAVTLHIMVDATHHGWSLTPSVSGRDYEVYAVHLDFEEAQALHEQLGALLERSEPARRRWADVTALVEEERVQLPWVDVPAFTDKLKEHYR